MHSVGFCLEPASYWSQNNTWLQQYTKPLSNSFRRNLRFTPYILSCAQTSCHFRRHASTRDPKEPMPGSTKSNLDFQSVNIRCSCKSWVGSSLTKAVVTSYSHQRVLILGTWTLLYEIIIPPITLANRSWFSLCLLSQHWTLNGVVICKYPWSVVDGSKWCQKKVRWTVRFSHQ